MSMTWKVVPGLGQIQSSKSAPMICPMIAVRAKSRTPSFWTTHAAVAMKRTPIAPPV